MKLTTSRKEALKKEIVACLAGEPEIEKIVIFGSFVQGSEANDLDIAVFQKSEESYLPLALKYRKKTRTVAQKIPLDIFPVRPGASDSLFLHEISTGEVIYER
ncbi:MAG: nucleotidyltransferase domain-containing protein [Desulfobacterales bacterium]|jgi:predicted nucleotidyltransferase|nr:nucleotidyltransferase domain-containing protein [Desulfobacterales bacterium]